MTHTKDEAKAATPHHDLIAELLNPNIPKTEREHAASREIERLQALAAHTLQEPDHLREFKKDMLRREHAAQPAPVREDWGPGPHEYHSLTAPVQEPVGVFVEDDDIGHVRLIPRQQLKLKDGDKLYTTPPAQPAPVQELLGYLEIDDIESQREYPHNCRNVNLWHDGGEGMAAIYTTPPAAQPAVPLTDVYAQFNAAIDFAIEQRTEAAVFLRAWREGDIPEWPEFDAHGITKDQQ